jgi:hypothetical protein
MQVIIVGSYKMEQKIKEIIRKQTGDVYIKTKSNNRSRALYKDNIGYYVYIDRKIKLVERFEHTEDIKKLEEL